jgi:hypothetical protein
MTERFAKLPLAIMRDDRLTPLAKIVYAALGDFQGGNSDAWPSVRTLAPASGATVSGVLKATAQLERLGLVEVHRPGRGKGNHYVIKSAPQNRAPCDMKRSTECNASAPQNRSPVLYGVERKRSTKQSITRQTNEPDQLTRPSMGAHMPDDPMGHAVDGVRVGLFDDAGETPANHETRKMKHPNHSEDAASIYEAYPRKVSRPDAIRAITKALERIAARPGQTDAVGWLLGRVHAYAAAVADWATSERKFVPYPASWFNGERYDDDQAEWKRGGDSTSRATQAPPVTSDRANARAREYSQPAKPLPVIG